MIRGICNEHACMDGNLAANLRNRGWLLEHGVKGGEQIVSTLAGGGKRRARTDRLLVRRRLTSIGMPGARVVSAPTLDRTVVLGALPPGLRTPW